MITGTIRVCKRCGLESRERTVPLHVANAYKEMIQAVSDEVVLLPVSTLNAIAERAESAERALLAIVWGRAVEQSGSSQGS